MIQQIRNNVTSPVIDFIYGLFSKIVSIMPNAIKNNLPLVPNNLAVQFSANVNALLMAIKTCEGTNNAKGYRTIFSYKYFTSFADHPRRVICSGGICSSASGAYQILQGTYDEYKKYGDGDFSPKSQDKIAVYGLLGAKRGVLNDIEKGNFSDNVIYKLSKEWASIPVPKGYNKKNGQVSNGNMSYYGGQPAKSMEKFKQILKQYGAKI